jgi:hypothetical protein
VSNRETTRNLDPDAKQTFKVVANYGGMDQDITYWVAPPGALTAYQILHLRMLENIGEALANLDGAIAWIAGAFAGYPGDDSEQDQDTPTTR